jgi:four helix bundle protein
VAKGDDIQERLVAFAVAVIALCNKLPEDRAGSHIALQLLRSATSPAPNYAEARGAESDRDFLHKLKIVLKKLNESLVWIDMIERGKLLAETSLEGIKEECRVLCRIIAASISTVRKRLRIEN